MCERVTAKKRQPSNLGGDWRVVCLYGKQHYAFRGHHFDSHPFAGSEHLPSPTVVSLWLLFKQPKGTEPQKTIDLGLDSDQQRPQIVVVSFRLPCKNQPKGGFP